VTSAVIVFAIIIEQLAISMDEEIPSILLSFRRFGQNLPLIGCHDMRRIFATWSNPTGESLKALQTQLGHTDSRTLGIYT
jgi:integrase